MKKNLKFYTITLILFIIIPPLNSCSAKQGKKDVLTLCEVTHSIFYAPQYAAINLGYFEEEGIKVELSNGQGADKVMSAILSNNVDIGLAGPEASIYVYNEGKEDYTEVFAQLTQRDGSFLVSRQQDLDFSWEKVRDKTILPGRKGGVPYMTLQYVLRKNGLEPSKDVKFNDSIQFSLMAGAFTSGTGDYVTLFEPTASMLEKEGKGHIVSSIGAECGDISYTAYFAKKSFIKKNQELILRFTKALYKGQKWVEANDAEEIAEVVTPAFPETDFDLLKTVIQRYKNIGVWSQDPILKKDSFELLQEVMTQAEELKQKVPYEEVVNNSFSEKVVKER
ncbi:ABC transporter substrate-binding protein [Anaerosacchariphilus polymeriproducens]|uniref:ABC transporter substrate-binding protein n=1 Tax=Anaerosacchariphilus polymeriproducens TaxID=1812858 RepID=A0A371ARQ1_9FIRM|nr:ABC transporter substrate-binding protein [Anaerosacchariphilus polymeriproducens]RDU22237.1 ABC transporter substrate-binding protein [Anaerosacchariphilus polymeriproducens]